MIVRALLLTFIQRTLALLVALTALLSSCDILGKSTALHGVSLLIALVGLIPSMMVYAFPLAMYLAAGTLSLEMVLRDEILMFWYFPSLARAWYRRLAFVTVIFGLMYLALAGTLSQQIFHSMRKILVASIEQQINAMDPGVMCHISKNLVLYADTVQHTAHALELKGLFVGFGSGQRRGACIAPRGTFIGHCFTLYDVTLILYGDHNPPSQGEVGELTLDVDRIFDQQQISSDQQLKRAPYATLVDLGLAVPGVYQECVRRIGLVIWFCAMPWLGWMHGVALGRRKKNIIFIVLLASFLLLILYMISNFIGLSVAPLCIMLIPLALVVALAKLF